MKARNWIVLLGAVALLWPAAAQAESTEQQAVAQRIASEIRESGQLSHYRVGVKYEDGVAWLLGSVTDQSQADAAMELARQVSGVQHVVSKLEIVARQEKVVPPSMPAVKESSDGVLLELLSEEQEDEAEEEPETVEPSEVAVPAPVLQKVARQQPLMRTQPVSRNARPVAMARRQPSVRRGMPAPIARTAPGAIQQAGHRNVRPANYGAPAGGGYAPAGGMGAATGASYDSPNMPGYAWPSYAAHPNYAAVSYPKQYSPSAWPYIGPFHPYPQVPLGWRKVALEWDDGWWFLDFSHHH